MTTPLTAAQDLQAAQAREDHSVLFRNAGLLFAGQAVGLLVPFATVPYLARVLGADGWGPVLAAQSLGYWLVLVLEFGFELSGTRAIARARAASQTIGDVVHGVQSAKVLLVVLTLPIAAGAFFVVPEFRADPRLFLWTVVFAVLRGLNPLWFFQGLERLRAAVTVDALSRAAAALAVFLVVRAPADGWRVVALQAVFAGGALVVLMVFMARHVDLRTPRTDAALRTLREGGHLFLFRTWSGLYITGNAFILSVIAAPATVAFFGGAERIVRAGINLLQPLTQAFLPRVSYLQASNPAEARRTIRRALIGVGLVGLAMGVVTTAGAPVLVHLLLARGFEPSIPVLRVMGVLPILVALNTVIGFYWAVPFGRERPLLAAIMVAGLVNVACAIVLVPRWGALGMALSAVAAEIVVLVFLGVLYLRTDR